MRVAAVCLLESARAYRQRAVEQGKGDAPDYDILQMDRFCDGGSGGEVHHAQPRAGESLSHTPTPTPTPRTQARTRRDKTSVELLETPGTAHDVRVERQDERMGPGCRVCGVV